MDCRCDPQLRAHQLHQPFQEQAVRFHQIEKKNADRMRNTWWRVFWRRPLVYVQWKAVANSPVYEGKPSSTHDTVHIDEYNSSKLKPKNSILSGLAPGNEGDLGSRCRRSGITALPFSWFNTNNIKQKLSAFDIQRANQQSCKATECTASKKSGLLKAWKSCGETHYSSTQVELTAKAKLTTQPCNKSNFSASIEQAESD